MDAVANVETNKAVPVVATQWVVALRAAGAKKGPGVRQTIVATKPDAEAVAAYLKSKGQTNIVVSERDIESVESVEDFQNRYEADRAAESARKAVMDTLTPEQKALLFPSGK